MTDRAPEPQPFTTTEVPRAGDPAGWYPDPDDRSLPVTWERYWRGEAWGGDYRHRGSASKSTDPAPSSTFRERFGLVVLVLACLSIAAPLLAWAVITWHDTIGLSAANTLLNALLWLGFVSATAGFLGGIAAFNLRGVAAILLSVLGAVGTLLVVGAVVLAGVLGGLDAGL
jgi:hypothetical protein